MRRLIVILTACALALCVFAALAIVFSPALRAAGIVGLAVAAAMTVALALAARRSPPATRPDADSQPDRPSMEDLDEATSLRNQPTWRDDVEGRVGPKW